MSATFFSGNKSANNGGILTVSFNSKDPALFLRVTKQTGWDAKINKPTFSGGETVTFKLTPDEAGEMIHAVSGHDESQFYHTFNNEVSTGNFRYYELDNTKNPGKKIRGFGLTLKKAAFETKIGFSLGSAERLSQYLQFALNHIFSAAYAQDKKDREEYLKKKDADKVAAVPTPTRKAASKTQSLPDVDPIPDPSEPAPPELVVEEGTDPLEW